MTDLNADGAVHEANIVVDPRVLLAAERTLLAWVRTGLALMGFGFVAARFGLFLKEGFGGGGGRIGSGGFSLGIGAALVVLGVVVNVLAARGHVRLIKSLKRGEVYDPSPWSLGVVVTLILAAVGLVMVAYLLQEA